MKPCPITVATFSCKRYTIMFEAQLAYYLNRYLGTYVQGLDTKSLKISVFKGDVTLRNLKLKPEALADLNLPITVKAGLVGSLTLKVGTL